MVVTQAEAEFGRIMQSVDPNDTGSITFDAFLAFMTRESTDRDSSDQIVQSFCILAGEKGYVTEADLRRDLPHEDAEYCIARMKLFTGGKGDIGALDYELFAQEIFNE